MSRLPRLAIVRDMREESWPSMDLVADMLMTHLTRDHADRFASAETCHVMRHRLGRVAGLSGRVAFNADRVVNRFWDYPRTLRGCVPDFDLFHLCDHSYAQLVHELPVDRTGVFCHDLDTFRCLLEPDREPRSLPFRMMTRRTLEGLRKARVVFHTTDTVREQILRHEIVDESRLVQAPYGISPEFAESGNTDALEALAPNLASSPFLLHVGSCIPRKRIDVLLDVLAALRERHRELWLVQVGGAWSREQREQIERLDLSGSLIQLPRQPQSVIAEFYRSASVVLMPSEAEGFGLPVIEALACGAVVVASDISVFREVGERVVLYCPLADVPAWADMLDRLLSGEQLAPARADRLRHAGRFSWTEHARIIADAYARLL